MYNSFSSAIHKHNSQVLQTHSVTVRVHSWLPPFGEGCLPALLQSSHQCLHLVTNVPQSQEVTYKNIIIICRLILSFASHSPRTIQSAVFTSNFQFVVMQLSVCRQFPPCLIFRHFTFDNRWIIRKSSLRVPYADPEVHY